MRRWVVDYVAQCCIEVDAETAEKALELAEEKTDEAKNERSMKAQLWENLQVDKVTPV